MGGQILRWESFAEETAHGPFDVSVPYTVDEGIQARGDHSLYHWGHCILPERFRQLSWGTHQGLFLKISKPLSGENHWWRRLYISHLVRESSEKRQEFYSKKKNFWCREKNRDGTNNTPDYTHTYSVCVRTGKVEEQRRVTEETRNFYILEADKL